MSDANGLHPLSLPAATALTAGIGSAAGAIVVAHVPHPTAGSAASAMVAGLFACIGGAETVARVIDPFVRYMTAPSNANYQ